MTWVTDHPPASIDLDACVTCGLCLPVCPTFRLTGDETASPRGRLAAIAAVDGGLASVDQRFDDITSFCLQCRACETACPSMVPYGDIIEAARAEAVEQVGSPTPGLRMVVGRVLAWPWALRVATIVIAIAQRLGILKVLPVVRHQASGLRAIPLPVPTARGGSWGDVEGPTVALFTGCVADVWFTGVHRAAIELLVAAGYRVTAPTGQSCCGALASHSGFGADAARMAEANLATFAEVEVVAVDVAGCGAHLKGYGRHGSDGAQLAAKVRDASELIAEAIADGRLPMLPGTGERVAVQDPCHLEHGQGITAEPRAILRAAGYDVVDADRGGLCCGAAGIYQLEHPDTGATLGIAKADRVRSTGARLVASANAGCEIQLRRFLDDGFEIRHPIELYREQMRGR